VLQYVAVCCGVLRCVAVCCSMLQYELEVDEQSGTKQKKSGGFVCCSMLQYVAVCCSVLQYVAVCCSMNLRWTNKVAQSQKNQADLRVVCGSFYKCTCWSGLGGSFHIYRSRSIVHLGKAISVGLLYGALFIYTGIF